jgi:hypothetical protein
VSHTADEFLDEEGAEFIVQGGFADVAMKHAVHRQEYYLQGLTLQSSNGLPGVVMQTSHETLCNVLQAPNNTLNTSPSPNCPVHNILLAEYHSRQGPAPLAGPIPMERYLEEGVADRYAIFNLNKSNTGDWARYNGCTCRLDL